MNVATFKFRNCYDQMKNLIIPGFTYFSCRLVSIFYTSLSSITTCITWTASFGHEEISPNSIRRKEWDMWEIFFHIRSVWEKGQGPNGPENDVNTEMSSQRK